MLRLVGLPKLCPVGSLSAFTAFPRPTDSGHTPTNSTTLPPSAYLKKLYFDSIVHSVAALQYLVQVASTDRVVIGTDYPMAIGDFESVNKINQLNLSQAERSQVLGGNAARALNL